MKTEHELSDGTDTVWFELCDANDHGQDYLETGWHLTGATREVPRRYHPLHGHEI